RYYAYTGDGTVQLRRSGTITDAGAFQQDGTGVRDNTLFVHAAGQQQAQLREGGHVRLASGYAYDSPLLQSLNGAWRYQAGGGKIAVQSGDSLKSLAQRVYGNANLWYVLADANGLSDPDDPLTAGTQLNAPSVDVNKNDAGTFKPYNPSEAIGSTTPSLPYIPPPPKNSCSTLAIVLMVVVAVAVAVFTAGAATAAIGAAAQAGGTALASVATATTVAGVATTTTTLTALGAVTVGAAAGAAGALAGQVLGSVMGVSTFSWRNVAAGAITGAITGGIAQGLGSVGEAMTQGGFAGFTKAAGLAVTNAGANYAGQKLAGVDTSFSWKSIAASAVTSLVTAKVAPKVVDKLNLKTDFSNRFAYGATGGVVSAAVRSSFGETLHNSDYLSVVADAFGNALGNAAVRRIGTWQVNRAAERASVQSGMPSLFDPNYKPGWLYDDGIGAQAMGGVDSISSVTSGLITIPASGDVPRGSSGDRRSRIDAINSLTPNSEPLPYDISDAELRGWEATYASALVGGVNSDLPTLATVEVIGHRDVAASWMNAYGAGGVIGPAWRMSGVSDAPRPAPGFDRFGRRIPAWAGGTATSQSASERAALYYGGRFVKGAASVVTEPLFMLGDLARIPYSVYQTERTGELHEIDMWSSVGKAAESGATTWDLLPRAVLGSNPFTGVGVFSFDMTTAALNGDWGGFAEGLGGVAGGFAISAGGQRWAAPQPGAELGLMRVRTANDLPSTVTGLADLPGREVVNFKGTPQPTEIGDASLYRVFDTLDPQTRGAQPNGGYWSLSPYGSEAAWRSGAAVQGNWNAGLYQGTWMPTRQSAWGGFAAPQAIDGFSTTRWGFKFGWINRGGDYQLYVPNSRATIQPAQVIVQSAPWWKR
ncbi:LysM peptidoglycan-binding domain-containing protein, partial [Lysobacter erysipheiresistens]